MLVWLCSRAARAQIPADLTPWYAAFRDGLRHTSLCHDSEMLEQPILLLAVVMSTEDDPIARFDELLRPENLPPPLRAETQHYDPDVPRMCVLVHDLGLHQGALTDAAKASFERIRARFGADCSRLLTINSLDETAVDVAANQEPVASDCPPSSAPRVRTLSSEMQVSDRPRPNALECAPPPCGHSRRDASPSLALSPRRRTSGRKFYPRDQV